MLGVQQAAGDRGGGGGSAVGRGAGVPDGQERQTRDDDAQAAQHWRLQDRPRAVRLDR